MKTRSLPFHLFGALAAGSFYLSAPFAMAAVSDEELAYRQVMTGPKATEEELKQILFDAEIAVNRHPAGVSFEIYNGLADRVITGMVITVTWTDAESGEKKSMDVFPTMYPVLPLTVNNFHQNIFRGEKIAKLKHEITVKEVRLRTLEEPVAEEGPAKPVKSTSPAVVAVVPAPVKTAVEDTYRSSIDVDLATARFTEWQPLPDSQVNWDEMPKDSYKAYLEGRNNKGLDEYRSVILTLDTTKYEASEVRSHLTSDEFFERGVRMKREGWQRMSLQVFVDGSGTARYQAVWLKPKSNGKVVESSPSVESKGGGRE